MPHVVLLGNVAVEYIFSELKPVFIRNKKMILKTWESYLERDKHSILIDSLAIEEDKKTVFLAIHIWSRGRCCGKAFSED